MKPRVFIGSSSESLKTAEYVKAFLQPDCECYLWTDNLFKFNVSFLDTLIKAANLFDFGILIAAKDDYLESRKEQFKAPRDNVIFEFGLFIGRLGPSRAFVLQEKGTRLPSDLLGISIPSFTLQSPIESSDGLQENLDIIRKSISEKFQLGELGLLPSTVLAIGYFHNFVELISEALHYDTELEVEGQVYRKFKVNIVMPRNLDGDIKKRSKIYFRNNDLKEIKLRCSSRSFPVYTSYQSENNDTLIIYDMPTTLSSIDKAIEMYIQKGHVGKSTEQNLLEEMELRTFKRTLQSLIDNDSFCRDIVTIINE